MKEVDFKCCDILYYIESDIDRIHHCYKCKAKFKKNKEGVWEKKTKL
jgi:hypothetical protein